METDDQPNPIVAMAIKLRARRDLAAAVDSATPAAATAPDADAQTAFAALGEALAVGCRRLNAILGRNGVTFVRLERPPRLRLRLGQRRIALDVDGERQLVRVSGLGLDGDYQFDAAAPEPALINLSRLSTDAEYGAALTAASLLKTIADGTQLARPPHLDGSGPLSF